MKEASFMGLTPGFHPFLSHDVVKTLNVGLGGTISRIQPPVAKFHKNFFFSPFFAILNHVSLVIEWRFAFLKALCQTK